MTKGTCIKRKKFYGVITLTDKGQIAIPVELRRDLGIDKGDKLIVIKRKDGKGLNLIKSDAMEKFLDQIAND